MANKNYEFPDVDEKYLVYEASLHENEEKERNLAEDIYLQMKGERLEKLAGIPPIKKHRKRKQISKPMLRKYKLFVKKTKEQELNPDAVFMYVPEKRSLLREVMNYSQLKGEGRRIPIDECSDSQVGKAFQNIYNTASKTIR